MDFESSALVLAWLAIAVLALAMAGLLRQLVLLRTAVIAPAAGGLGPVFGSPAPVLPGIDYTGRRTVLLFADDECESCRSIVDALDSTGRNTSNPAVVVLFKAGAPAQPAAPERQFVHQRELFDRLGVNVTPFAVMVDGDARIVAAEPLGSAPMFDEFRANGARTESRPA